MSSKIFEKYFKITFIHTFPNTNRYFSKFIDHFINHFNGLDTLPKLHRWCNKTSPIYKNICNLEKKIDNANRDNCYTNIR